MIQEGETLVTICICTYKRGAMLARCLQSILQQSATQKYEVIITDNDINRSAEQVVEEVMKAFQDRGISLKYFLEPIQNISLARNRSVRSAMGKYVAFIDDDETASDTWLQNLLRGITEIRADGVWGAVTTHIPDDFPSWMRDSKLFKRKTPRHGTEVTDEALRTGNVLIRRKLLLMRDGPFDESLGKTGGEDTDLFNWIRLNGENIRFVWIGDAEVIESITAKRRRLRWHLRRAYRGGWGFSRYLTRRHGRVKGFILSIIRILPSSLKALAEAIGSSRNIRYAGLIIILNIAANLGKCGYFLGLRLEEYKN